MFKNWITLKKDLGSQGSELGIILIDEELPDLSRITIEKARNLRTKKEYFALTVGIYGRLVHTAYFEYLNDAKECFNALKVIIQVLLNENSHF